MKRLSLLTTMVLFFSALCTSAAEQSLSIDQLVDQYYAAKTKYSGMKLMTTPIRPEPRDPRHPHCPPEPVGPSCTDTVCAKLGSWGCDDLSEIERVGKACRGNLDGSCVTAACAKLGSWGCDDMSEAERVARACVGNYETDCMESVCKRLGSWGCDDMTEIEKVLQSCAGN